MNDKKEVLSHLREAGAILRSYGVERIGLFGSFVRNEAHSDSDVDVMVECDPGRKTLKNLLGLAYYLRDAFGREVEVVTPQSLSPFLAPHILKEVEYVALAD